MKQKKAQINYVGQVKQKKKGGGGGIMIVCVSVSVLCESV